MENPSQCAQSIPFRPISGGPRPAMIATALSLSAGKAAAEASAYDPPPEIPYPSPKVSRPFWDLDGKVLSVPTRHSHPTRDSSQGTQCPLHDPRVSDPDEESSIHNQVDPPR